MRQPKAPSMNTLRYWTFLWNKRLQDEFYKMNPCHEIRFDTIKIIDNCCQRQLLEKKYKHYSFPFIPLLNSFTGICLVPTMGLTLLDAVFPLVKEMGSAYSLQGAYSQKSKSDTPRKKEEGGGKGERGKGRRERKKLSPWKVGTSGPQLGRKSQAAKLFLSNPHCSLTGQRIPESPRNATVPMPLSWSLPPGNGAPD